MLISLFSMIIFNYSNYVLTYSLLGIIFIGLTIYYGVLLLLKKSIVKNKRPVSLVLMALMWLIAFTPFKLFPNYESLIPTGPYTVNHESFWIIEGVSQEGFSHKSETREIFVECYYGLDNTEERPIVLYSHGGISTPYSNETLLKELASYGITACTMTHPYHTLSAPALNGNTTRIDRSYFNELMKEDVSRDIDESYRLYKRWMTLRTDDLNVVMDELNRLKYELTFLNTSNLDEIILIGHSLGGSAALCFLETPNVLAVIALESPYMCDIETVNNGVFDYQEIYLGSASLHIYTDSIYHHLDALPQYKRNLDYISLNARNHQHVLIEGSGHFSITDLGLMSPVLTRLLNQFKTTKSNEDTLLEVNDVVRTFIEELLKE
ncbi:hypothetical protein [Liberiplasma polymorphum]|uniref:hypothetical protein n=1 Tax=Liberiplasma polymorphum TaxID=3374570 RepID=UPI003771AB87